MAMDVIPESLRKDLDEWREKYDDMRRTEAFMRILLAPKEVVSERREEFNDRTKGSKTNNYETVSSGGSNLNSEIDVDRLKKQASTRGDERVYITNDDRAFRPADPRATLEELKRPIDPVTASSRAYSFLAHNGSNAVERGVGYAGIVVNALTKTAEMFGKGNKDVQRIRGISGRPVTKKLERGEAPPPDPYSPRSANDVHDVFHKVAKEYDKGNYGDRLPVELDRKMTAVKQLTSAEVDDLPWEPREDAKGGQVTQAAEKSQQYTKHRESTAPTQEQLEEAVEFLHTVLEIGAPQNKWEQNIVKRILTVLEKAVEVGRAQPAEEGATVQEPPPPAEPASSPEETRGAFLGGVSADEESELQRLAAGADEQIREETEVKGFLEERGMEYGPGTATMEDAVAKHTAEVQGSTEQTGGASDLKAGGQGPAGFGSEADIAKQRSELEKWAENRDANLDKQYGSDLGAKVFAGTATADETTEWNKQADVAKSQGFGNNSSVSNTTVAQDNQSSVEQPDNPNQKFTDFGLKQDKAGRWTKGGAVVSATQLKKWNLA